MATIEILMEKLGVSKQEAIDIIAKDKMIDAGLDPFPLTEEQKKACKKARSVGRQQKGYTFNREKKVNPIRKNIISILSDAVQVKGATEIKVINDEREFTFSLDGVKYKITLSAPRK